MFDDVFAQRKYRPDTLTRKLATSKQENKDLYFVIGQCGYIFSAHKSLAFKGIEFSAKVRDYQHSIFCLST